MSVSFTRSEIERTITERIRLRAVALGYLPDVMLFQGNLAGYEAARQAIIAGGKEIVDIFGVGSLDNRGEKFYNRIFLNLRQYNNGTVSHWGESSYVETQSVPSPLYSREQVYGSTRSLIYDIRSVCGGVNATEYDRLCLDMIMGSLTTSNVGFYLPVLKPDMTFDNTRRFGIRFAGSNEIKTTAFFERLMSFEVFDVWLDGETSSWDITTPTTGIVPLIEVEGTGGADELPEPNEIIVNSKP
jgi:hypothetical protein